jgi:menaquinone-dependent protoporphyrinogen oxidase
MKVLVTVASRHGATTEIGEVIAEQLRSHGLDVDTRPPEEVGSIAGYDGVIVGSGIYLGKWLGPAKEFVEEHVSELKHMPVWLFGSGPITPVKEGDAVDTVDGDKLNELISARGNTIFPGELKKDGLNIFERVSVSMVGSPWGDYRPWAEIRAWADTIADAVVETAAVPAG